MTKKMLSAIESDVFNVSNVAFWIRRERDRNTTFTLGSKSQLNYIHICDDKLYNQIQSRYDLTDDKIIEA